MDKQNYKNYQPQSNDISLSDLGDNNSLTKMVNFVGENKRVIDFGCASGYLAGLLRQRGCQVTGLEINPEAAKTAQDHCEEVFICDLDYDSLENILGEKKFDVAVFGDVLEHLKDPWQLLEKVKKFLNPSGFIVVSIPNIAHGAIRLALLEGDFDYQEFGILDSTHLRFFTRKTVEELLEKTGYFIHQIETTKVPIFSGNSLIPSIIRENFASEIIDKIQQDPNKDVLQFVIKSFPSNLDNKYFSLKEKEQKLIKVLQQTQNELGRSQSYLQDIQSQLQDTQSQLKDTQSRLKDTQSRLNSEQVELKKAKTTIFAMETSKFWKLRKKWFAIKNIINSKFFFRKNSELKLFLKLVFALRIKDIFLLLKQSDDFPISDDSQYNSWLLKNYPSKNSLLAMINEMSLLKYKPLISIIIPVFNTPKTFLREAIESVISQVYANWEICIADDSSTQTHVRSVLNEYRSKDNRIKVVFREENGHISRSSNSALEIATGDYIALLDHDDLLTPHALYEVVKLLNQHPEADMIYSDEDKINEAGKLQDPFFKPDWCPDSFLSRMYTSHLGVYRRSLIHEIGGFREGYEGAQDYDLVLRFTEKTDQIFHIPNILYHWRIHSDSTAQDISTKNYATDAARKSIEEALFRRGEKGEIISVVGGHHIVRYEIKKHDLVSIIIPTKNLGEVLNTCLKSIFEKTTYPNYEVLVIDNGSTDERTLEIIESWKEKESEKFRCEVLDIPFNFSKINNYAVQHTRGKYLLFQNNDTEVIDHGWLTAMVEQAQRPSIGAVGALLLYSDDTIQHAGVVGGIGGVAGHSHKYYVGNDHGYFNQLKTVNNYSAVTAACIMCRREVFEEVGGFEESLTVAFNDIDLCFKMIEKGYRNVYLPHVKLYHYESKSRGYEDTPEKQKRFNNEVKYMQSKWQKFIEHDPCYNPNLTKNTEDYAINIS